MLLALTIELRSVYNSSMISAERKTLSVAIDGPAGAGKSTVARRVADALGCTYIDTGAMYRALAWAVLDSGTDPRDIDAVLALAERLDIHLEPGRVWADGREITEWIRTPQISNLTSPLAALPEVRARMVTLQQGMARRGGVVMEGRDIGTVVLPEAEVKIFLTASLAERVRRRREELLAKGMEREPEILEQEIAARDARDSNRETAPLKSADDAVCLDSDLLSADDVVAQILKLVQEVEDKREEKGEQPHGQ